MMKMKIRMKKIDGDDDDDDNDANDDGHDNDEKANDDHDSCGRPFFLRTPKRRFSAAYDQCAHHQSGSAAQRPPAAS